ncbi:zinc finger protein 704 isoform X1 [Pipistrellus kuhlii]|uniref:zinc finger protein 704 isoform X1 n=1 Tax=Pipistrellus kuhlii TaxID=59472 RepID=UPI001E271FA9|nr:zinc finger protein 704 isoform X1 [Pipistrellus kuhlii]
MTFTFHLEDLKRDSSKKLSHQPWFPLAMEEDGKAADSRPAPRAPDHDRDSARSVCLLEQKRKVVSSSIDVPPARKSSEELDMDKVTAAMVLTSLSTSPLVRSPPVRPNEGMSGSWKEGGAASSSCSSGYWSWSAPSDQSNPSTPSPPLSADCAKPFRSPAPDDGIDEAEAGSLLFDEPIPRKRKNSMKVMFKCLWKNCGKVLSTAAGIQKHIRGVHLGRAGESDYSDGEEDFYYTEIKLHTDAVADGLGGLAPASPSQSLASPPTFPIPDSSRTESPGAKAETKLMTPLSRSAPTTLYLVHTDHAYQATPPVTIPGSAKFTPNGSSFSVSWQSPPVTFTGIPEAPGGGQEVPEGVRHGEPGPVVHRLPLEEGLPALPGLRLRHQVVATGSGPPGQGHWDCGAWPAVGRRPPELPGPRGAAVATGPPARLHGSFGKALPSADHPEPGRASGAVAGFRRTGRTSGAHAPRARGGPSSSAGRQVWTLGSPWPGDPQSRFPGRRHISMSFPKNAVAGGRGGARGALQVALWRLCEGQDVLSWAFPAPGTSWAAPHPLRVFPARLL